jgi:hypothetical protein
MTDHPRTDPDELVERLATAIVEEIGWGTFSHFDPNDVRRIARAALRALPDQEALLKAERERQ